MPVNAREFARALRLLSRSIAGYEASITQQVLASGAVASLIKAIDCERDPLDPADVTRTKAAWAAGELAQLSLPLRDAVAAGVPRIIRPLVAWATLPKESPEELLGAIAFCLRHIAEGPTHRRSLQQLGVPALLEPLAVLPAASKAGGPGGGSVGGGGPGGAVSRLVKHHCCSAIEAITGPGG